VTWNGAVKHTLFITNDNDFNATEQDKNLDVVDDPNQFFVFAFDDNDLPGFVPLKFTGHLIIDWGF